MVRIIIHGGVNEVGGNKILVEDKDTRILLDFGMSYNDRARFYSEPWLSPKDEDDLLEFGILPKLEGIYRFDDSKPSVDAFFLSHAHTDHYKYVSFLKRDIPMYCGRATKTLLSTFSKTRYADFEHDLSGIEWHTFTTGDRIRIGEIDIEPVHVDHSIPASYAFLIHTSAGVIAYTADLRVHGIRSDLTSDFVNEAKNAELTVMISEGTNLGRGEVVSEEEVRTKISKIIGSCKSIVLAGFSMADLDRLRTFYNASRENNRTLAISLKQAYMLKMLKEEGVDIKVPALNSDGIVAYKREKKRYYDWEREVIDTYETIDASEIKNRQSNFVLVSLFSDLRELVTIKPESGSCYIYSSSEPFNEESEIEFERFQNWLDHFALPIYHVHASGHIMPNDLREMISEIKPKNVIPIHTDHAYMFSRWCSDIAKFTLPEKGKPIEL